jgi:hypothetical protein
MHWAKKLECTLVCYALVVGSVTPMVLKAFGYCCYCWWIWLEGRKSIPSLAQPVQP